MFSTGFQEPTSVSEPHVPVAGCGLFESVQFRDHSSTALIYAYNHKEYIETASNSVLAQVFPNEEIEINYCGFEMLSAATKKLLAARA
jgi:hypothetical protein